MREEKKEPMQWDVTSAGKVIRRICEVVNVMAFVGEVLGSFFGFETIFGNL
jgi:hypothetical protein